MLSVEAARGREFEHVVVANVRPGAFPLWYSPEAFLFSPRLGMIPKENVGRRASGADGQVQLLHVSLQGGAAVQRARAPSLQLRAARELRASVLVTASGTPTRGVSAPELLEELR